MRIVFVLLGLIVFQDLSAQQRLEPGRMHYLTNPKPNSIFYRDTLYRGSKEFMQLFYRTRDQQLIDLYGKHQSNKITGQMLGVVGSFAMIFGISRLSSNNNQKGLGWGLLGGGFVATITSGALILQSQRQLYTAVTLFNQRHNKASLGIGLADKQAGLVYKF